MNTKHSDTCTRVFARYDTACPRCQELATGQPARIGWGAMRAQQDAMRIEAIRSHDFAACASKHGACTHFDY